MSFPWIYRVVFVGAKQSQEYIGVRACSTNFTSVHPDNVLNIYKLKTE